MAEIKTNSSPVKSEALVIALLNIMFAVFQLVMVAYSLGQSMAIIAVNSTLLADAATGDGAKFIFNGPFFVNDGEYASGYACAVYLALGSLIHLGIGLLLLHGSRKESGTLCLVWFFVTSVFLIGHVVTSAVRAVNTSDLLTSTRWSGPQILTAIFPILLISLEGLQIWVVYEFAIELPNTWCDHKEASGAGTHVITSNANICKGTGAESQEKTPSICDDPIPGNYPENTKIQLHNNAKMILKLSN